MTRRHLVWRVAPCVVSVACGNGGTLLPLPDASPEAAPIGDATSFDDQALRGTSDGGSAGCDGSPCQPVVLAEGTNPSGAGGLALDATRVYWVDSSGGKVLACAKTGCGRAPTILASGQGGPSGIAVLGGVAYWTNEGAGTVASCATSGCGGKPTVLASGLASPSGIAALASKLYWVEAGKGGSVEACATTGCGSPTVLASARGLQLAVDDARVYWTDGAGVNECPLGGCLGAPAVLFAAAGATGIALDAENVYVTADVAGANLEGGAVLMCAKTGCGSAPIALATGQPAPMGIAVSSTTVYWGNTQGNADIWACASGGCKDAPRVVTMAALPSSIAVDDANVYWASLGAVLFVPE